MDANSAIAIWGATALGGLLLGGLVAGLKNRDYSHWMAWGFLFPPSVLVLLMLPKIAGARPRRRSLDEENQHD